MIFRVPVNPKEKGETTKYFKWEKAITHQVIKNDPYGPDLYHKRLNFLNNQGKEENLEVPVRIIGLIMLYHILYLM